MKLQALRNPTLQGRIVLFFVLLLAAVQGASFYVIRAAIEQAARTTLREELQVGSRVFRRLLDQNSQQLLEATSVLTFDFGFREAIASRDQPTILSALTNHAARIRATGMSVTGLDGVVVADTRKPAAAGGSHPFPDLLARAGEQGRATGIRMDAGKPFQVVVVPVLAPLPIAWVSMEFVIDNAAATDLQRLSSSHVSFVSMGEGPAAILASTLRPERFAELAAIAPQVAAAGASGTRFVLGGEEFEALATPLEAGGRSGLYAVLQRSVAEGIAPYLALQAALLVIAGLSLAVTLLGAVRIARRVSRPVARLAEAARAIERGDYTVRSGVEGTGEVGDLARAFDGMARGLGERDRMRDVLGKVASSDVVAQLLEGRIDLGGVELDATVMFTDVRNFTALCEQLEPQQSLALLNELLTVISEVIEAKGGVVDKYLGDGAMGLFGAPVAREGDTRRAVEAALEIQRRMAQLRPRLAGRGLPAPLVGVGLNTASVVAGNIGSATRLNYTVLGDGVNLAARLESLTKRYHVPIVVGARTRSECGEGIVFRELDKVRVRGRSSGERIYEPLGAESEITAEDRARLDRWHALLEAFRARRWQEADAGFAELASVPGYERLISIYRGYVATFAAQPPGPEWDGAFTLYEK